MLSIYSVSVRWEIVIRYQWGSLKTVSFSSSLFLCLSLSPCKCTQQQIFPGRRMTLFFFKEISCFGAEGLLGIGINIQLELWKRRGTSFGERQHRVDEKNKIWQLYHKLQSSVEKINRMYSTGLGPIVTTIQITHSFNQYGGWIGHNFGLTIAWFYRQGFELLSCVEWQRDCCEAGFGECYI